MMMADKILKDVQALKKMYGDNIDVEVGDEYYVCYFKNSIGQFKFLVNEDRLNKPFALSFTGEYISKAIEKLQEI